MTSAAWLVDDDEDESRPVRTSKMFIDTQNAVRRTSVRHSARAHSY